MSSDYLLEKRAEQRALLVRLAEGTLRAPDGAADVEDMERRLHGHNFSSTNPRAIRAVLEGVIEKLEYHSAPGLPWLACLATPPPPTVTHLHLLHHHAHHLLARSPTPTLRHRRRHHDHHLDSHSPHDRRLRLPRRAVATSAAARHAPSSAGG